MVLIGGSPETMWLLLQESPGLVSLQFSVVWTKQIGFSLVSFLPRFSVVSTKNHLFTVQIHVLRTQNTGNRGGFWISPRFSVARSPGLVSFRSEKQTSPGLVSRH